MLYKTDIGFENAQDTVKPALLTERLSALREKLTSLKVDGILITNLPNLRYLTGFTGSSGFSIITKTDAIFVTDFRYQEQAREEVKGFDIRVENIERAMEVRDIVDELKIRHLGFEGDNVTYWFYVTMMRSGIRLKPLRYTVESLRMIKSDHEVSYIKMAIKRAEKAFERLKPHIKSGITEIELSRRLEDLLKDEGCERLPFEVIVASGPRSALPHARPTSRALRKGDILLIDWGGEYEGYYSDMTRTVLIGDSDISKHQELYLHVLNAQERAIKKISNNIKASTIDSVAKGYIKRVGYGDYFGHGLGHGVGLQVHEKPIISWKSKDVIKTGMVFTVEPGIYIPQFGGIRIEDMVVVSENGVEVLTSLSKELTVVET